MSTLHNSAWLASRSLLGDNISLQSYHPKVIINMNWEVEYTDEFEQWWEELDADEQESVTASVGLLEEMGVHLPFPHSSGVNGSKHSKMRELRIQHKGDPYRILYAFDPRRSANLLVGGNKTGDDQGLL